MALSVLKTRINNYTQQVPVVPPSDNVSHNNIK